MEFGDHGIIVGSCAMSIVVFGHTDKAVSALLLVLFASALYFLHLNICLVLHNRKVKDAEKSKFEGTKKKNCYEEKAGGERKAG